ncbi:MAG: hypothetical protein ABSE95_10055 [Thermodesulfobacteriota bacterium]|jgi:hypothetical protein
MLAEGYDLEKIVRRVAEIMDMEPEKMLEQAWPTASCVTGQQIIWESANLSWRNY